MLFADVSAAVKASIAELTGTDERRIGDHDRLVDDLGVDSMVAVNLLVAIEDRLGARVPSGADLDLIQSRTVADLTNRLLCAFVEGDSDGRPPGSL